MIRQSFSSQKGFTLVEIVVAIALLAIIGVGFLGALSNSSRFLIQTDERETAKNIAETQMEYIKSQGWAWSYDQHPDIALHYPGYIVLTTVAAIPSRDTNIQKITVTVQRDGRDIFSITSYKEKPSS